MQNRQIFHRGSFALVLCLSLAACGGGGGVSSTPTPTPTPSLTPAPTPTPSTTNFNTVEYQNSDGPVFHGAITAWQAGASGQDVTVGVIDTGIDIASPEFSGRISGASRDFGGNGSYQDQNGHGTAVTGVLAAARNDREIMGIAFEAEILALRADTSGSCDTEDGCTFSNSDIAAALNHAASSGARVVNLSMGGEGASNAVLSAVNSATRAGVIIVVSAGNERDEAQPASDPNNPSPFATDILAAGNGLVIIVPSVNDQGMISPFSNLAGTAQSWVLSALGEGVRSFEMDGAFLYDGTSFSAPHVAGAAALLAQAFPNLTSAQIVELLLESAQDAGAAGTDSVYGRGILDIAAAFAPSGTTSVAGSTTPVSLTQNGTLSAPMGDAAAAANVSTLILDSYGRAYQAQLGGTLRSDLPSLSLAPQLQGLQQHLRARAGGANIALSIAEGPNGGASVTPLMLSNGEAGRARARAGYIASRLGSRADIAIGFSQSAGSLSAMVRGSHAPAFLIASSPLLSAGFRQEAESSFALRWKVGRLGLTVSGESGDALVRREWGDPLRANYRHHPYSTVSVGLDGKTGPAALSLSASHVLEEDTVLGAQFSPIFGAGSARTLFLDADLRLDPGGGWGMGASWRQGWSWAASGGALQDGALLKSNAFALDLWKDGAFGPDDRLAFRISQPLRISSGGLNLTLPGRYDYATGEVGYALQRYDLAPRGRQVDMEAAYGRPLGGGDLTANLFFRKDSGNMAWYPDDMGLAVRFSAAF